MFSSRERAGRATPCSCPAAASMRSARVWSSLKSSRTRTRPIGCSIGTASGLDGKPRELHIPQSLASIDFNDFEPALAARQLCRRRTGPRAVAGARPAVCNRSLANQCGRSTAAGPGRMHILGVVSGPLSVRDGQTSLSLAPGQFCLIPASLPEWNSGPKPLPPSARRSECASLLLNQRGAQALAPR